MWVPGIKFSSPSLEVSAFPHGPNLLALPCSVKPGLTDPGAHQFGQAGPQAQMVLFLHRQGWNEKHVLGVYVMLGDKLRSSGVHSSTYQLRCPSPRIHI